MADKRKKFYVASSIAYVNAKPHLGFALEIIQADVLARYHRIMGRDVFFLTGTDEHGTKIARVAEKEGKSPEKFTDEISEKFRELTKVLNISNSDFIRTTDKKRHWPNVEKVWKQLKKRGDIYKKKYKGLYCVGCEAFLKEKDLVGNKCPNHQKEPEIIEEENYFFKLSKYANQIKKEISADKIKIIPLARKNEILRFIDQGIEDVSCSRSKNNLEWGIPVPGDSSQIIYIWFEALINYLFPKNYWPADVHCVGKDILRFHALLWSAMLIAVDLKRPKTILVHGFITSGGQKMSKSLGNVVDPFGLVDEYGADAVRYFLLREIPSTEDGDFTLEKFKVRYNADLANGLGNFAARVSALKNQFLEFKPLKIGKAIGKEIEKTKKTAAKKLEEFKFNESLAAIWGLIAFGDKYINQTQVWKIQNPKSKFQIISNLLVILNAVAMLLTPFLPETSAKIARLKKGEILFPRR